MIKPGKILSNCLSAAICLYEEQYTYKASALVFTTLLSIVPLISVFIYVMEKFAYFSDIYTLAKHYVVKNFLPGASVEIISYLNKFSHQAAEAPIISIVFLFITAILLINTIDSCMKMIWEQHARHENILYYLLYPVAVLLIPVFIALIAGLSSYLYFLFEYLPVMKFISASLIPLIVNTLMLAVLYKITASITIKWHEILKGSLIASLLLEISKYGFTLYIKNFTNYEFIYGAFGVLPIFLIWLYIFWLVMLYGAFLSKVFHQNPVKEKKR